MLNIVIGIQLFSVDVHNESSKGYKKINQRSNLISSRIFRKFHMVKILWRSSVSPFLLPNPRNYLTIRDKIVDADFILNNDHVTLHGIDKDCAWFCVTEPRMDVYSSSYLPFTFANQYFMAKRLIVVSHADLHELAGLSFSYLIQLSY